MPSGTGAVQLFRLKLFFNHISAGSSYTDWGGTAFDDYRGGNSCTHDCAAGKPSAHTITWGSPLT